MALMLGVSGARSMKIDDRSGVYSDHIIVHKMHPFLLFAKLLLIFLCLNQIYSRQLSNTAPLLGIAVGNNGTHSCIFSTHNYKSWEVKYQPVGNSHSVEGSIYISNAYFHHYQYDPASFKHLQISARGMTAKL
jgi:hypothetical protein